MCGIAGVYSLEARVDASNVGSMLSSMAHRGPDDRGIQLLAGGMLAFGHLRLSIIDLSPLGHQPMATSDGNTWIVYNGEIYNYRELRDELRQLGWNFRSDSDTEVILAAYRTWGLGAVTRFRGMFAFAIWDSSEKLLHLCRDRFGVKPLYFSVRGRRLAFASELKGLLATDISTRPLDSASIAEFVQYGYISSPRSIFADVCTVRPGTVCSFDARLKRVEWSYWSARDLYDGPRASALRAELNSMPEPELLERVEKSLQEAFSYRMVADVPVGLFLSGGIDSSLVAAVLARRGGFKLKTFTIGFGSSEFDESDYARTVATTLGTEHFEFSLSPQLAVDTVAEIPDIADEPIGDSSLVPTLLVSRLARRHVKVALSADGADELFGGYARYAYCGRFVNQSRLVRGLYSLSGEILDSLPPEVVARGYAITRGGGPKFAAINDKLRKFIRMSKASDEFDAYDAAISEWPAATRRSLMQGESVESDGPRDAYRSVRGTDPRDRFMHFDMTRYLPGDLLVKVDRASMATSLEAREPFLDHESARLAAALSMRWKVRGNQNKYILRTLLKQYFPPTFFERPKQGFSAPIGAWLRGPLKHLLRDQLSAERVRQWGILDSGTTDGIVDNFFIGSRGESAAGVWILLQLQQWAGRWLKQPAREAPQLLIA
jgi:asparagine synthase (glutamine-hydrolysing)